MIRIPKKLHRTVYSPFRLKTVSAGIGIALLMLAGGAAAAQSFEGAGVSLLSAVNRFRRQEGIPELILSVSAEAAAEAYAAELSAAGKLSHTDARGNSAVKRYRGAGGTGIIAGEILGRGPSGESIFRLWLKSPRHRSVILDSRWTQAGAASATADGTTYAAVTFTASLVESLTIADGTAAGCRIIRGVYTGRNPPVIYVNGDEVENGISGSALPAGARGRVFEFAVSEDRLVYVVQLGYREPGSGKVVFTDMTALSAETDG